jgi:hypothetical protein
MQYDLWGNHILHCGSYLVFHDESQPTKRWLLIGLLFVQERDLEEIQTSLLYYRRKEQYFGEIHFSDLPKSFEGKFSAKAKLAKKWLKCYEEQLCTKVKFTALAVDRLSPRYDYKRFSKDFHAYNRFTAMALKAGISWFLAPESFDRVSIKFISDQKDRRSRPDKGLIDNFESYIPYRTELDCFLSQAHGRRYPDIKLELILEDSKNNDLLQLCDLLLGSVQMAIVGGSKRIVKQELGDMIAQWLIDLRKKPWEQNFGMHRKFSLWAFPDANGRPYNNVPLALKINSGQLDLFN